jgi:hypothetical protein
MADIVNKIVSRLALWCMQPLEALGPWPALGVVSLVLALFVLVVYKLMADPAALRRSRNVVVARVLELRLFKDDPWSIGGSLWRVLVALRGYVGGSMKILLVLIVPVMLLLVQLEGWFGHRALLPGEKALLTLQLGDDGDVLAVEPAVAASEGLEVETGAFRWPATGEIVWRIRGLREGDQEITVALGDRQWTKRIAVDSAFRRISRARAVGFWSAMAHPFERKLPAEGPIASMRIDYPRRPLRAAGVNVHWLLALFILTMVFALILKRPFRVEM